ncbi:MULTISPECIES: hypothetical protein [unclassified Mesorhizobium]|nr:MULTISPECIES: hypothetical protein [unclassified Mesorhizobium]
MLYLNSPGHLHTGVIEEAAERNLLARYAAKVHENADMSAQLG